MHLSIRLSASMLVLATLGCSQRETLEFSANVALAELPERHQKNVSDELLRLFGTPVNPRMRGLDPEAEEPEEGESASLIELAAPEQLKDGAHVYKLRCAGCHGVSGDGNGPAGAHLRPRPRDYRKGIFKFTSTPYGSKPARHDLVRTIRRGAKGTSMPGFPWMSERDLNAVIDYVIFLSRRGEVEGEAIYMSQEYDEEEDLESFVFTDAIDSSVESWADAEDEVVLPVTAEPKYTEETVTAGRELYLSQGCSKCHGVAGKGQVEWINPEFLAKQASLPEEERVQINLDTWGEPAPAADLTARMLHGGRRPIDIYRRIYTGINGTPMPEFGNIFASDPDKIWHLVHYVRHIIEGGDPTAGIEAPPEAAESEGGAAPAESASDAGDDSEVNQDTDVADAAVDPADEADDTADEAPSNDSADDVSDTAEPYTETTEPKAEGEESQDVENEDAEDDAQLPPA